MELWIKHAKVSGYADNTATSVSASTVDDVINKLELDAERVLRYMASNSLSANPKKTGFLLIRVKRSEPRAVMVGGVMVPESENHKILGIMVNNTLSWRDHIDGELIPSVNRRVGALKRVSHHIPSAYLPQIASAIVSSKIRYGAAIYGAVRLSENDPTSNEQRTLQIALNNAMRVASGRRRSERTPIIELCRLTGMKSLNPMSAEEKLMLVWQSQNNPDSPLTDIFRQQTRSNIQSRAITRRDLISDAKSELSRRNIQHQAVKLWNFADTNLRLISKRAPAKRKIQSIANGLPL